MKRSFGKTKEGLETTLYTLKAGNYSADITDFGATLVSFVYDDGKGFKRDVVLGFDSAQEYQTNNGCLGATIGRSANRIKGACFTLNGITYHLPDNERGNNLHSGPDSYYLRLFKTVEYDEENAKLVLFLNSPDLDQGYPGNIDLVITYTLSADGRLHIKYEATPDKDTILNITNHAYFNADGSGDPTIMDQKLQINATEVVINGVGAIPTGEIRKVEGTDFDFIKPTKVGDNIDNGCPDIEISHGFNSHYIIQEDKGELKQAAYLYSSDERLRVGVATDYPGIMLYTGNMLGDMTGKNGVHYQNRCGLALEAQFPPNAINMEDFPKPIVRAGENWEANIVFSIELI